MSMQLRIEDVSPEQAKHWLTKSRGNRNLNQDYVLSLALAMDQGKWVPEASEVVFDVDGGLIDGHHRLHAIVTLGKTVQMAVKRHVPLEARSVIDTGRVRSLPDLLTMYRSDVDHPRMRRAALTTCVDLLVVAGHDSHRAPPLRTIDDYDRWIKHFKDGIDWIVSATLDSGQPGLVNSFFSRSAITGSFAFAFKTNPEAVKKFHERTIKGEGLRATEPALTLRNYILSTGADGNRSGIRISLGRRDAALKVLAAIHAALEGRQLQKLQVNSYALPNFREAYAGRAVDKLVKPWMDPPPEEAQS